MIQKFEAKQLKALIHECLNEFAQNPVSGATFKATPQIQTLKQLLIYSVSIQCLSVTVLLTEIELFFYLFV